HSLAPAAIRFSSGANASAHRQVDRPRAVCNRTLIAIKHQPIPAFWGHTFPLSSYTALGDQALSCLADALRGSTLLASRLSRWPIDDQNGFDPLDVHLRYTGHFALCNQTRQQWLVQAAHTSRAFQACRCTSIISSIEE